MRHNDFFLATGGVIMDLIRMRHNLHNMWLGYGFGAGQIVRTPRVFLNSYRFAQDQLSRMDSSLGGWASAGRSLRFAGQTAMESMWNLGRDAFASGDRAYGLGMLGAMATPLIAGAAAFSGLVNLSRGRQGMGIALLALGMGLTAGLYGAPLFARSGTPGLVPASS